MRDKDYTAEILKEFNERFRNTSWYPDNWQTIEDFIAQALTKQKEDIIKQLVENADYKALLDFNEALARLNKRLDKLSL